MQSLSQGWFYEQKDVDLFPLLLKCVKDPNVQCCVMICSDVVFCVMNDVWHEQIFRFMKQH